MAEVFRRIYDLHFSISEDAFDERKQRVLVEWSKHKELDKFWVYVEKQWLKGNFRRWQAYLTPCGFATTNDPCETFNRAFKRDYT
ncbi:hypothetical protein PF004_g23792 [Phytophthora fragariae]|uniref:Uncharacterized protein n=1 Tax=Phytophthora fragariae TaxID=53985 RepID=A0A6G0QSD4_9STRA|nr:hypothetical protein PF004_g23792 [Phytophthora fragariae]KAE9299448.1 hypothetical protein PF008_g23252 [Phytophthora fragariae]